MHYEARPVRHVDPANGGSLKKAARLAGALISVAGTLASIGRMTKVIPEDCLWSHILSRLAIGVHLLEGTLLTIKTIKNCLENIPEAPGAQSQVRVRRGGL